VQPRGHGGVTAETSRSAIGIKHGVLEGILGVLRMSGGAQRNGPEPIFVTSQQRVEGCGVASDMTTQQFVVGDLLHTVTLPGGSDPFTRRR
jgi:hypothetical protein